MPVLEVTKTLIIGLGGTGLQICDQVLQHLQQTFDSVEQVPWVQFMAIDTDGDAPTLLRQQGDFVPIGLDPRTYGQILDHPGAYGKLDVNGWTDQKTLRLKTGTDHGTGNVRMLGRLSLMAGESLERVRIGLLHRLTMLRQLSEAEAQQRLTLSSGGSDLELRFHAGVLSGDVRVVVVGSLCGGTGGGLAPEFGYLLNSLLHREMTLAFFTLPHSQLTAADSPHAERLKKNAFHALIELNQSFQVDPRLLPSFSYWDGSTADMRWDPYGLPFLVAPKSPSCAAVTGLTALVAERVYANIVHPDADPYRPLLAAGVPARDSQYQAHVFSTFGLATVELPAAQIIESCTAKLLADSLESWQHESPAEGLNLFTTLGLERASLTDALLQQPLASWEVNITSAVREETEAPRPDMNVLNRQLSVLHQFLRAGGEWQAQLLAQREQVFDSFFLNFQALVTQALLNHARGPRALAAEIERLLADLVPSAEVGDARSEAGQEGERTAWQNVEGTVVHFGTALNRRHLLRSNRAEIRQAGMNLQAAVHAYVHFQLATVIQAALQTRPSADSRKSGLIDRLQKVLTETKANLRILELRITALKARLDEQHRRSAQERPPTTGLVLYEPQTTVQDEYRRAMTEIGQRQGEAPDSVEMSLQREIIASWTNLPAAVIPPRQPSADSWLNSSWSSGRTLTIPERDLQMLWNSASQPFQGVWQQNVLERLPTFFSDWEERIRNVAAQATPALSWSSVREFFPITRDVVLGPATAPELISAFTHRVGGIFAAANTIRWTSPDPTRLTFLKDVIRVPLRAFDQILGEGGLHSAVCEDFPSFHTRKDVAWLSLTSPGTTEPVNEANPAEEEPRFPRLPDLQPQSMDPFSLERAQAALLTYLETYWGSLELFSSTFVPTWRNALSLPPEVRWGLYYAGVLDHNAILGKAPELIDDVFEGQLEELDSAPVPVRQARAALILLLKARGESLEQFRKSIECGDVDLMALPFDVRWGLKYAGLLNQRVQHRP